LLLILLGFLLFVCGLFGFLDLEIIRVFFEKIGRDVVGFALLVYVASCPERDVY